MTYEYEVPYVDFITAFGKNDDADTFFDINKEVGNLTITHTVMSQDKNRQETNGRVVLQEIACNIQNSESPRTCKNNTQSLSSGYGKSHNVKTNSKFGVVNNAETIALSTERLKQVSSKKTLNIKIIEEENGKLHVKNKEIKDTGVPRTISTHTTKLNIRRSSFEERQKLPMKKRQEQMKKILQEEKQKREFHATPMPRYLKQVNRNPTFRTTMNSIQNNVKIEFRAHPAYVIRRQPFLPKKSERPALKTDNVVLHSEKRAKARKEFDEKLRLHYKNLEDMLEMNRQLQQQKEKEEIAELRKKLVHKAQPIRRYKPEPGRKLRCEKEGHLNYITGREPQERAIKWKQYVQ